MRPRRRVVAQTVGLGLRRRRTVQRWRRIVTGPARPPRPESTPRVDELDRKLIAELADNGRLSVAELGRRIGLSRTATLARLRNLESSGIIRGYHADIATPTAGPTHEARVAIALKTPDFSAYVRRLTAFDELKEAESIAGEYDLMVRFATHSAARLDEILDRVNGWRETVRTTTFMVLTKYR